LASAQDARLVSVITESLETEQPSRAAQRRHDGRGQSDRRSGWPRGEVFGHAPGQSDPRLTASSCD